MIQNLLSVELFPKYALIHSVKAVCLCIHMLGVMASNNDFPYAGCPCKEDN